MNKIEFFVRLGKVAERYGAKVCWDVRQGVGTLTLPDLHPFATQILALAMSDEVSTFVPPHLCETRGGVLTATCP
jgi:hypothetical protein